MLLTMSISVWLILRGCCNRLSYLTFESLSCIYWDLSYFSPSIAAHFMAKNFYNAFILAIWCLYAAVALLKMCIWLLLRVVFFFNYSQILQQFGFALLCLQMTWEEDLEIDLFWRDYVLYVWEMLWTVPVIVTVGVHLLLRKVFIHGGRVAILGRCLGERMGHMIGLFLHLVLINFLVFLEMRQHFLALNFVKMM